jgi:hypothetical protein
MLKIFAIYVFTGAEEFYAPKTLHDILVNGGLILNSLF